MASRTPMPVSDDWKAAATPWKLVRMVAGRDSRASCLHARHGVAERHAGREIEGDRDRGQLPEVRDGQRADGRSVVSTRWRSAPGARSRNWM